MAEEAVKTSPSIDAKYDIVVDFKERVASGCGNALRNFQFAMQANFGMMFMTDVAGINPALVGMIQMINSFWDAINDPLIGSIADNTLTKKGQRYTPYLLFFIPVLLMAPLGYIVWPGWEGTNKLAIYIFALGFIGDICTTLYFVPYEALVPAMTTNSTSRASIQSTRSTMAFIAQIACSAVTLPLILTMTNITGNRMLGYFLSSLFFSILAIPLGIIVYKVPKERVILPKDEMTATWAQKLSCVVTLPYLTCIVGYVAWGVFSGLFLSARSYWYRYYIGQFELFTVTITLWTIGMTLGSISTGFLNRGIFRSNKKFTPMLGFGVAGGICLIAWFIDWRNMLSVYNALSLVIGWGNGMGLVGFYILVYDINEYVQYHKGIRPSAFLGAGVNFALKCGMAVTGAALGFYLANSGYVANADVQTPEAIAAIQNSVHLFAGLPLVIAAVFVGFNPLNTKKHEELVRKLEKGEYAPGVAPARK